MASIHKTASAETAAPPEDPSTRRAAAAAAAAMDPSNSPPHHPLEVTPESSFHRSVAHLNLAREECSRLFPSGRIRSQPFHLAGHVFFLTARCDVDQQSSVPCFGLFLAMTEERSAGSPSPSPSASVVLNVDYDFAARTRRRPSGEFVVSRYRQGYYNFTGGKAVGYRNLFGTPWAAFMADDSDFFVDGVLHLRVELSVKQP